MNKVILMGRLTREPQLRYSKSATPVAIASYSLAVKRAYKKEGQAEADFINITSFGKAGEFANKYFKKGQMVAITGRLQINVSDGADGKKKYYTSVIAEEQHFAESKANFKAHGGQATAPQKEENNFYPIDDDQEDDLPF